MGVGGLPVVSVETPEPKDGLSAQAVGVDTGPEAGLRRFPCALGPSTQQRITGSTWAPRLTGLSEGERGPGSFL